MRPHDGLVCLLKDYVRSPHPYPRLQRFLILCYYPGRWRTIAECGCIEDISLATQMGR